MDPWFVCDDDDNSVTWSWLNGVVGKKEGVVWYDMGVVFLCWNV